MLRNRKTLPKIYITIILLLIYIPIISLVIFSFNGSTGRTASLVHWNFFSFQWYEKLFTDPTIKSAVWVTLEIAFLSTLISTIIGTMAAISLSKSKKVFRNVTLSANNIPIVNPEIITALSLFVLFGSIGITSGFWKMLLAHISFSVPYVLITVYPKVRSLDDNLIDAAYDLGATPIKTMFKVVLPQLKGSMIAGAAIAFAMSFDDFIISYFVGGESYQNISAYIYSLRGTINPSVNALSTIIIFVIGIKVTIDYIRSKRRIEKE
ncbi:similar to spermidine/putrescine ABC transporter, spermidine/putrescine-binding protein [Alteracholeplasma palmae J233]|uniref:Similar to spermidine/putrescine ABC transporter, spermidine/putrescine-binding protein n=1 Tax=Alteracholeplasma palmae (strain ATCC 49389 / J233) TaxID=1318466 RepID=U4KL81_ALTPJ|nr:ABC transporter permease [Alteracholeplasma palmae]CCV64654.1 similar to spermidine/putrescine ABC transporter, spermidine/putrescine-binding protein [Alteracholeplasma palmae J233]